MGKTFSCSVVKNVDWIGLREILQETIDFRFPVNFPVHQSIEMCRFDVLAQEFNIYKVETVSWNDELETTVFPGSVKGGLWFVSAVSDVTFWSFSPIHRGWRRLHSWNG